MEIKTKSGFKCEIDEKVLDDWRFAKAVVEAHSKNNDLRAKAAVDMVHLVLRDNEDAFYEHLAKKNGDIITEDVVVKDLGEIISQLKSIKNS